MAYYNNDNITTQRYNKNISPLIYDENMNKLSIQARQYSS